MMKRRLLSCCVILFIAFVAFMIVYPMWQSTEYNLHNPDAGCKSNLKQIALTIFMYSEDYGGKLPPAIFPGKTVGWANGIQPYITSYALLQCPAVDYNQKYSLMAELNRLLIDPVTPRQTRIPQANQPGFTDYWMNSNLAGVTNGDAGFTDKSGKINYPEQIIMLGDGDGKSPQSTASYSLNQLPSIWRTSSDSPAKRHLGGANYAFLDGHVKWLKPAQVSQLRTSKKHPVYTFSVR
jgi:prepilin-type processing-associated H-X9-DG protein